MLQRAYSALAKAILAWQALEMITGDFTPHGSSLSGLVLSPTNPKSLVLFLHGYGANGADLLGIGQQLSPHMPSVGFVAPDAPQKLAFGHNSRAWFELGASLAPEDIDYGVQEARPVLVEYVNALLHTFDLPAKKLLICGFSQGCMLALEVAPRLPEPVGQVIGLSGALAGADRLAGEIVSCPPIFLGHGMEDNVVPFAAQEAAVTALKAHNFLVESKSYEGVGHGIPSAALQTLYTKTIDLTD